MIAMVGMEFKMKRIYNYVNNKKGSSAIVLVLAIFIMIVIDMVFGITETSLDVMTINEVKDIIMNVAPIAAREGINEEAHKNETLNEGLGTYDSIKAKNYFKKEIVEGIENMNFRSKIKSSRAQIEDSLERYTEIKQSKGTWANTWSNLDSSGNKKEVDYVIVSTVLPLELKNNYSKVDIKSVNKAFNISNERGEKKEINVELKLSENGLAVFLKVEMKVVLT